MALRAGWYPQDDGRERYWDGERWTDAYRPAGGETPAAEGPAAAEQEGQEPAKTFGCLAWVIGVPVVLGLIFAAKACTSDGAGSDDLSKYNVQGTCQDLVRKQLKNPSTADFTDEQQSTVSASGNVVAENALGGKVTYAYRCTVSGDTVTLQPIQER